MKLIPCESTKTYALRGSILQIPIFNQIKQPPVIVRF